MSLDRSRRRMLVVGAGPTGLTLAVELARHGFHPEIVDKKSEPSQLSRAVGINPRSLELFEPSGMTAKLLGEGIRIRGGILHDDARIFARLRFSLIRHRYNFLLSLPQDQTERLLLEKLATYGVNVRWNTTFEDLAVDDLGAIVHFAGGEQNGHFEYVFGCDGVGSQVRQSLGITFSGRTYDQPWSVADIYVKGSLEDLVHAHLYLQGGGTALFTIPIGRSRVRAVATRPNVTDFLGMLNIDYIARTGEFTVQVRQAGSYRRGPVFLAGDAAHTHSPAGGRGMNLGIGDASILAECITQGRLDDYQMIRKPVGETVLKQSERMAQMAMMTNSITRKLRNTALHSLQWMPIVERRLVYQNVSGLGERDL